MLVILLVFRPALSPVTLRLSPSEAGLGFCFATFDGRPPLERLKAGYTMFMIFFRGLTGLFVSEGFAALYSGTEL